MSKVVAFFAVFLAVGALGMVLRNDIVFASAPVAALVVGIALWMREGRGRRK